MCLEQVPDGHTSAVMMRRKIGARHWKSFNRLKECVVCPGLRDPSRGFEKIHCEGALQDEFLSGMQDGLDQGKNQRLGKDPLKFLQWPR